MAQNLSPEQTPLVADLSQPAPDSRLAAVRVGVVTFPGTLDDRDAARAVEIVRAAQPKIGFDDVQVNEDVAKVSVIGVGMRSHPGVSATAFRALAKAGINIEMISTSEIRISVVTRADQLDAAVRAAHTAFDLDSAEGEAIVYGGTGR